MNLERYIFSLWTHFIEKDRIIQNINVVHEHGETNEKNHSIRKNTFLVSAQSFTELINVYYGSRF